MRGNLLIRVEKTATLRARRKGCEQAGSHFSQSCQLRVTKHPTGAGAGSGAETGGDWQ